MTETHQSTFNDIAQIWEGRAGEPSRPVKRFDLQTRATSTARSRDGPSSS